MPRLSDLSQWMHPGRSPRGSVAVVSSLLLHSLLLVFLLHARHARLSPVLLPGTRDGSRYLLTYFPGRAQVQTGSAVVRRPLLKTRKSRSVAQGAGSRKNPARVAAGGPTLSSS